jgi:hypothetical protein
MYSAIKEPQDVFSPSELARLKRWIRIYESPLRALFDTYAEGVFRQFDNQYFERTGQTEESYLSALLSEVKHEATLRFTDGPSDFNATMFQYPEEQRAAAYREFETAFVRKCTEEEDRLKFKAYVARRLGLRVPFKRWR